MLLGGVKHLWELVIGGILLAEMVLIPNWLAMQNIPLAVAVTTAVAASTFGVALWIERLLDRAAGKRR